MSAAHFARLARSLREALLGAVWVQWRALGGQAAVTHAPAGIVDPEALVLASLWLKDDEPRLWDFLYGFATMGSRLLSVQRIKGMVSGFPEDRADRLASFAAAVAQAGRDPRWRALVGRRRVRAGRPGKTAEPSAAMALPAALMLRLRAGFGVDVRTDALTYLIGRREAWADVREMASALGYAKATVRGASEALADARLIERSGDRPARYYASGARWCGLLGLAEAPAWQPWARAYPLALALLRWLEKEGARPMSDALASSLAREWVHTRRVELKGLRLDVGDALNHRGEAFLPVFDGTVVALAQWIGAAA